ncbi:hypothetical protein OSB04_002844 [Centaurea solstitialis]|uniref:Sugar phosphate transporter domain-containing protein n=1 Tax=Centaurea solstitialis TaxID=347529 RepID=A0AA38TTN8_9ASTR|nr:hypothetical protein OSB04_002844 [Centaurea solstitialis]
MEVNRPPDPPITRNRAKKNKQNKGLASTIPFSLPPATTAAVPACDGTDVDRLSEGSPTVVVDCKTTAVVASSFVSSPVLDAPGSGGSSPTSLSPSVAADGGGPAGTGMVASAICPLPPLVDTLGSLSRVVGTADNTAAAFSTMVPPSSVAEGCFGSSWSSTAVTDAVTVFILGFSGVKFGGSHPFVPEGSLKPSTLSVDKGPNAGSFVDSEGNVHLHAEESSVAHKPVSFADLLKKSANLASGKGKLKYYPPVITELGTRRAIIPDELIQKQASEWALTLAGYFIGKRPAFPFVQYHARRMWKQFGLSEVILNDQAYFFFKFNSEQGLNFVLENGPWLFNGMPIFIQQWQPGLCFDKPEPKKVPLWVNIFGLPLDVWDFEIISYITSVVGEPISVDRYTEEMCETKAGRANFARVLVNASADYELPTEIDAIILGKLRKFRTEFLWKPKRCSFCKVFGHDLTSCSFRPRTVEELNIDKPVPSSVGEPSKAKVIDDGFIFPKRKNKLKPKIAPLKVGGQNPKVVFNTGVKINQRFVPKTAIRSIDTIDKGKATIGDDKPPPKVVKTERMTTRVEDNTNSKVQNLNTERIPIKVSNQFTVLEEHPKWTADKKEVDCYVEKRGVGLEPVIINFWSRQKLEYFIDRWERVFGKELDGKLRGFTLPDRIDVGDDDDDDTSDDDVLSDHDIVMDTRPKKVSWSDRQKLDFKFPLTVSCIHFICSSIGAYVVINVLKVKPLISVEPEDRWRRIFPMSFVFCINIVLGNVSLRYIPVSFMQTIKSFTLQQQWMVWRKYFDWRIWASLVPIVGGILLTSVTELSFNALGFCAALFGCLATSTKTILAESLLHGYKFDRTKDLARLRAKARTKSLTHINTVYYMAPFATMILAVPALLLEGAGVLEWIQTAPNLGSSFIIIIGSGVLAFCLNFSIFYVIHSTTAVTFNVAGNLKVAFAVAFSWMIFKNPISAMNALGCAVTLVGCTFYGYVRHKLPIQLPGTPRTPRTPRSRLEMAPLVNDKIDDKV